MLHTKLCLLDCRHYVDYWRIPSLIHYNYICVFISHSSSIEFTTMATYYTCMNDELMQIVSGLGANHLFQLPPYMYSLLFLPAHYCIFPQLATGPQ